MRHFPDIEKAKDKVMVIFVCEGNPKLVDLEESITREKSEECSFRQHPFTGCQLVIRLIFFH